jgi:hypothetical protein
LTSLILGISILLKIKISLQFSKPNLWLLQHNLHRHKRTFQHNKCNLYLNKHKLWSNLNQQYNLRKYQRHNLWPDPVELNFNLTSTIFAPDKTLTTRNTTPA